MRADLDAIAHRLLMLHPRLGRQLDALARHRLAGEGLVAELLRLGLLDTDRLERLAGLRPEELTPALATDLLRNLVGEQTHREAAPSSLSSVDPPWTETNSVFELLPDAAPARHSARPPAPRHGPTPTVVATGSFERGPAAASRAAPAGDDAAAEAGVATPPSPEPSSPSSSGTWRRDPGQQSPTTLIRSFLARHVAPTPDPPEWRPVVGEQLGRWSLTHFLGEGASAGVWGAHDMQLHIDVALKILHPHMSRLHERFLTEAYLLAGLNHMNIVRVFDCGRIRNTLYVVEEWMRGATAGQLVRRLGRLSRTAAVEAVYCTARALAHAQRRGLVHRDVKPDNIFVSRAGEVKLGDFGLAHPLELDDQGRGPRRSGRLSGSPAYMAPEWGTADTEPGPEADIYSLGITLYQLITGTLPFRGQEVRDILRQHAEKPLPSIASIGDPGLRAIILRMTAKNPAERYTDYRQLLQDLRMQLMVQGAISVDEEFAGEFISPELRESVASYLDDAAP